MRRLLFALALALAFSGSAEAKRTRFPGWNSNGPFGWTYTCRFPKHGLVVIDAHEPGSSITYRGRKYPATDGAYFFMANDKPEILVMFQWNYRRWFWDDGDEVNCARRKNRR
jgi:hypothetical protein